MKSRNMRCILPLLAALFLAACADTAFEADVTRFHSGEGLAADGRSVTVRPARDALEGMEFGHYAALLGERLGRLGFSPASADAPDLVALLDYSIAPVGLAEDESSMRIGIGGGTHSGNVGIGGGLSFPVGSREPETAYTRRIGLVLEDAKSGARIWEGRAVSLGKVGDLGFVFPLLVDALLMDFPGPAGRTIEVEIPLEGRETRDRDDGPDEGNGAQT